MEKKAGNLCYRDSSSNSEKEDTAVHITNPQLGKWKENIPTSSLINLPSPFRSLSFLLCGIILYSRRESYLHFAPPAVCDIQVSYTYQSPKKALRISSVSFVAGCFSYPSKSRIFQAKEQGRPQQQVHKPIYRETQEEKPTQALCPKDSHSKV